MRNTVRSLDICAFRGRQTVIAGESAFGGAALEFLGMPFSNTLFCRLSEFLRCEADGGGALSLGTQNGHS